MKLALFTYLAPKNLSWLLDFLENLWSPFPNTDLGSYMVHDLSYQHSPGPNIQATNRVNNKIFSICS